MFYNDPTFLMIIPFFLFALWAQWRVKGTYRKYLKVNSRQGLSGARAARMLLDSSGLSQVSIEITPGELTDHYDPRKRVLRLSQANHEGSSIAAVGVACHEAGHALQHHERYAPLQFRQLIWPVVGFSSKLLWPIIILSFVARLPYLLDIAILLYAVMAVFALVTLPVEFDASKRALALISSRGIVVGDEKAQAKKVLNAAAMTYVAAALMAVVQVLRLMLLRGRR